MPFEPAPALIAAVEEELRSRGMRLKHVSGGVRRLSDMFVERAGPLGDYLTLPPLLAGYVAYYLPVNALKVRWVLEEMKRYAPGFLDRPLRVLDFGSGPGAALLGLAEVSTHAHRAVAVDRVPEALQIAAALVAKLTTMKLEAASAVPPGTFDLILAANVLSELESEREIRALLDQLEPPGYLVIVEPALQEATKRLMALRDALADGGWRISAPCLGMARCPMRAHGDLWCHMDVRWTRPGWIQKIDDHVGLRKDSLKFSYLVVTKEGAGLGGSARVVSDLHREKGKLWAWLCGSGEELARGELLKRDAGAANADFRHAHRGHVLEIPGYSAAARVRFGPDANFRRLGGDRSL